MVAVKELTEDSFHIVKVSDEAMRDIQYVISAHEPLIKFLEVIMTQIVEQKAEHKRRDRRGSDHTN